LRKKGGGLRKKFSLEKGTKGMKDREREVEQSSYRGRLPHSLPQVNSRLSFFNNLLWG